MNNNKITSEERTLAKIFCNDYEFNIPNYQRPYSWGKEQTEELFDDLFTAYSDRSNEMYFLGSIVLIHQNSERKFDVVDGQQRLTTLTILLAVLANRVDENSNLKEEFVKYLIEPGAETQSIISGPRFSLRAKDEEFFYEFIQKLEVNKLIEKEPMQLANDAQRHIQANCKLLDQKIRDSLTGNNALNTDTNIKNFCAFLMTNCLLVVVSTYSQDSAVRIFTVMNSRGLDLQATDILKAEIISEIPSQKQDKYTNKWEDLEASIGRDKFNDLFSHIRMIYAKSKAKLSLIEEFKKHISQNLSPEKLIDEVMQPYTEALSIILNKNYKANQHSVEVNQNLEWLNSVHDSDWVPVALLVIDKHADDPDTLNGLISNLERLAAAQYIIGKSRNRRIERYASIIKLIEKDELVEKLLESMRLTTEEKDELEIALDGPIYNLNNNKPKYILLRLDSLLAGDNELRHNKDTTIEHVLPQTINPDGEWADWWPDENKRDHWCHRLANLVLLNKRRNTKAQNYDFKTKKDIYFSGIDGVPNYAITSKVTNLDEWKEEDLKKVQEEYMQCFKKWYD